MTELPRLAELLFGDRRPGRKPRQLGSVAVEILDALQTHGAMRRKEIALAAGLDPRHGTVGDALRRLTDAGVIGPAEGSRRYVRYVLLRGRIAELLAADNESESDDEFEKFEDVEFEPPGLPAPACRCGGQVYFSEDELRCVKCGHRPAVAA